MKKLLVVDDSYVVDTMHMIQQDGHLKHYEIRCFCVLNKCQIYLGDKIRLDFVPEESEQICREVPDIIDTL